MRANERWHEHKGACRRGGALTGSRPLLLVGPEHIEEPDETYVHERPLRHDRLDV